MTSRLCLTCGAAEAVHDGDRVWPPYWRCARCATTVAQSEGVPLYAPALADTVHGMDPAGFAVLAQAEQGNFWFLPRNRLLLGLMHRYFPDADSFLEIGCGSGFVLAAMAKSKHWSRLAGSELHPTALRIARQRVPDGAELVQMDARAIPASEAFDVIGAFDVIEHIELDEAVLASMHRAARKGIIIAVPQHEWLWSHIDELAHHVRRYRRRDLEEKICSAGFRIEFSGSYTSLLLPLMIASRWLARLKSKPDATDHRSAGVEFDIPRPLNGLLKAILHFEVACTLAGMRFPFGGSRIVVARKIN